MSAISNGLPDDAGRRALTLRRIGLCAAVIALGLALRGFGLDLGLPGVIVKYGGSILWATMVFFLVAIARPRWPRRNAAMASIVIAIGVELFRLIHTPWLDAFRLTLPGALLLGRIFSLWNMLAYGAGIILGLMLDRVAARFSRSRLVS
ncbi:MAG TPA: DUF2809 domain-containing protein [Bradyrhizobium sp.]